MYLIMTQSCWRKWLFLLLEYLNQEMGVSPIFYLLDSKVWDYRNPSERQPNITLGIAIETLKYY